MAANNATGEDNNAGSGSPVVKKQKKRIDIRQLFEEKVVLNAKEPAGVGVAKTAN